MQNVTQILSRIESGDAHAARELLPLVYDELRKLAAARLAQEQPGQTLQATALVHEAYLRLVGSDIHVRWNGRHHFFGAAAEAMRRILVDAARRKSAEKHGGHLQRVDADIDLQPAPRRSAEVLAVNEALDELAAEDSLTAELVKLHYFVGLPIEDAAECLGMSRATAYRAWTYARAWLRATLADQSPAH